jgi:hypothetical protein
MYSLAASKARIREMEAERIYMVLPSRLKKSIPQYRTAANVITFEDFLEDHLDPRMTKWKKQGDIS